MENCENCRWRKDLVMYQKADDGIITKTYLDGYACLGYFCDSMVAWIYDFPEHATSCKMFTPKEE